MSTEPLKIGELAKRTGSLVETIRYYEREGLLPAPSALPLTPLHPDSQLSVTGWEDRRFRIFVHARC